MKLSHIGLFVAFVAERQLKLLTPSQNHITDSFCRAISENASRKSVYESVVKADEKFEHHNLNGFSIKL